jgi:hypothetical protein
MKAVQDKPVDTQELPETSVPRKNKGLLWGTGRENVVGFLVGRFVFVVVGTMFIVMVLFTIFMTVVAVNEPYLTPYVENDKLYQDKIYLQVEGETTYREIIIAMQPGNYDQREITQLPSGTKFKVIFTPKNLEDLSSYFITFTSGDNKGKEPDGGLVKQDRFMSKDKFYSITIEPKSGKWEDGRYEIDAPSGGMFGGRYYAYFTIGETKP